MRKHIKIATVINKLLLVKEKGEIKRLDYIESVSFFNADAGFLLIEDKNINEVMIVNKIEGIDEKGEKVNYYPDILIENNFKQVSLERNNEEVGIKEIIPYAYLFVNKAFQCLSFDRIHIFFVPNINEIIEIENYMEKFPLKVKGGFTEKEEQMIKQFIDSYHFTVTEERMFRDLLWGVYVQVGSVNDIGNEEERKVVENNTDKLESVLGELEAESKGKGNKKEQTKGILLNLKRLLLV